MRYKYNSAVHSECETSTRAHYECGVLVARGGACKEDGLVLGFGIVGYVKVFGFWSDAYVSHLM